MYLSQNLSLKFKSVLEISYHKTTELTVSFDYQMEFTIPNMSSLVAFNYFQHAYLYLHDEFYISSQQ
jgi:hypothetical protein